MSAIFQRDSHEITCLTCGRVFSRSSEWDMYCLDGHEHDSSELKKGGV